MHASQVEAGKRTRRGWRLKNRPLADTSRG